MDISISKTMKIQRATEGKWLQSAEKPYIYTDVVYLPDNAQEWQEVDEETKTREEAKQLEQEQEPQLVQDNTEEMLEQAKATKIKEIEDYDQSENVNQFSLNGHTMWLDKDTRVGLRNLLDMQKNSGMADTLIWYEGMKIELPIDTAYKMLSAVELYAFDCYNTTESHKVAVKELATIEEVEAYDVSQGYPKKLEL